VLRTHQKRARLDREQAEMMAAQALAFLAQEPQRLARFLALTGIELAELRERAGTPEILAAVLSHLTGDESLLLTFAAETQLAPESIPAALALLQD
jgi:hypothetical protein